MKLTEVIERSEKYIADKMFPSMVNWQRVACRAFIGRIKRKQELLDKICRGFSLLDYADSEQNIHTDELISDLKNAVKAEGYLEIDIELLGLKYKLSVTDIEELGNYLRN